MKLVSYLSPGIPEEMFRDIAAILERRVGPVDVAFVTDRSGPRAGLADPWGDADLAYMCDPAFRELRGRGLAFLVPAGMVFADDRNGGRPVYFSDVVVKQDHPARRLEDLADATWAVNDDRSLSGYWVVVRAFPHPVHAVTSGSHRRSAQMVAEGLVEAAAIDSNLIDDLGGGLRVVHSLGPNPIQPLVASPELGRERIADIAEWLIAADPPDHLRAFVPVSDSDYPD